MSSRIWGKVFIYVHIIWYGCALQILYINEIFIFYFQFPFSLEKEILDRYLEVVLKGNKDGLKVCEGKKELNTIF